MMRTAWLSLLPALTLSAQVPQEDARVTNIPGTNTHFSMPAYRTLAEWEARKAHLRAQILSAAGLLPLPERNFLNATIFGRIENKDYSIEKVYLETMPGYYLAGNLYRPLGKRGRFPGVLTPHGHWTYGRLENQPNFSGPALGISLARQGHVAFAYDMVGYTDTIQTPHSFGGAPERLWSFGPLGLQLWNSIRALDFLESLPDVDPKRLAATGASGGGTQTFLLAAVDDRVSAAAPVNMVSAIMQGGSPCENAPGLRFDTFNVEFAAMMAPRPLLLVSATGDWTKNVPKEEFPAIQSIYALYGKPENVEVVQMDAGHNYNQQSREAVYRFFGKRLLGAADEKLFAERNVRVEKLQDMLVWHNRRLPDNALTYDKLFEQWRTAARKQSESIRDMAFMRQRLLLALGAEWPAEVLSQVEGEKLALSRRGRGDLVRGLWIPGKGTPVVFVDPEGSAHARASAPVKEWVSKGRPVLLPDVFSAQRDQSAQHFLTFNRSDDANRVQDILTALAFVTSRQKGVIELYGSGRAGVWCLFAAAVAPVDLKLASGLLGFLGDDQDFERNFFVPGIQRAGGLKAALALAAAR